MANALPDLKLLRIFVSVVRHQGFANAQHELNLSTSAISTYMSQLEAALGLVLKLKIYTVTQVLEKRYNPMARTASAVIMLAYALMIGVVSILAIGTVLQVLFDLPFWLSVLVGGGVVVIYSAIGGMWSLTLTDIVQFVIKTVGLMFILLPICLYRVGGVPDVVACVSGAGFGVWPQGSASQPCGSRLRSHNKFACYLKQ